MCPIRVRGRTKAVRVNTASCVDQSTNIVQQMVRAFRPLRGIKGALDEIADKTGVSYWKLRKLWNPSLRQYGFTLEADEHSRILAAWSDHQDAEEAVLVQRLDSIRRSRAERAAVQGGAYAVGA